MVATKQEAASLGGKARAAKLSPERRSEIATKAIKARWENRPKKATHTGELKIGEIVIPCYVLDGGARVISLRGMENSLGLNLRGGAVKMADFVVKIAANGLCPKELTAALGSPIEFIPEHVGRTAFGYEATVLADICELVLDARVQGPLTPRQRAVAERCEILVRGFARVGIIALVDEATGYQRDRARKALHEILEKFIAVELQRWAKRFPDSFFRELFRLRGLEWPCDYKIPQYVGHIINDVIYRRLAPGVLDELRNKNPMGERRRKHCHHQWLSENIGHPKLQEHISAVTAVMRISRSWQEFQRHVDVALPRLDGDLGLFAELDQ